MRLPFLGSLPAFPALSALVGIGVSGALAACPDYAQYAAQYNGYGSSGRYNLSYQRPAQNCRTFVSADVENTVDRLRNTVADPDLFRLFENSFPNTLDTAIKWKGTAAGSDEELTFVITGDINAMWLRDSANQMQSYLSVLKADSTASSIASLYRGVINLQARYLLTSPYCNSFQPPVESGIGPSTNGAASDDNVHPSYNSATVFECKYELDSLAAFLEVSTNYYTATNDLAFFGKYQWTAALQAVMNTATAMQTSTYAANGQVQSSRYTFQRETTSATETLPNSGAGSPSASGTGLIRSAFRPSDDSTIYQLFIPANLMFARYLSSCASILSALGTSPSLAAQMNALATSVQAAVKAHGVIDHPVFGEMYAYEIDGFGSRNLMDDANIPSLLSLPFLGVLNASDATYENTRAFVLSASNPYMMRGPVLSAVGGPHAGLGRAWPMASIVRILTSSDQQEIVNELKQLVSSTDGLGLIHESVESWDVTQWTRPWFSWANGLFGQMILDLEKRMPGILKLSFQ